MFHPRSVLATLLAGLGASVAAATPYVAVEMTLRPVPALGLVRAAVEIRAFSEVEELELSVIGGGSESLQLASQGFSRRSPNGPEGRVHGDQQAGFLELRKLSSEHLGSLVGGETLEIEFYFKPRGGTPEVRLSPLLRYRIAEGATRTLTGDSVLGPVLEPAGESLAAIQGLRPSWATDATIASKPGREPVLAVPSPSPSWRDAEVGLPRSLSVAPRVTDLAATVMDEFSLPEPATEIPVDGPVVLSEPNLYEALVRQRTETLEQPTLPSRGADPAAELVRARPGTSSRDDLRARIRTRPRGRRSAPSLPLPPAAAASPRVLHLNARDVWFAGSGGYLGAGRGVMLRETAASVAPKLELAVHSVRRLQSGEPSPVGFRVRTNYLAWLARFELVVEQRLGSTWSRVFGRAGPVSELAPVLSFDRAEVAALFAAPPELRAQLKVFDAAGRADRTEWLEFTIRAPQQTYEGLALVSPFDRAAPRAAGAQVVLAGARSAELRSLGSAGSGSLTSRVARGRQLAELLLPLGGIPPVRWGFGAGDAPTLRPAWIWEGREAETLVTPAAPWQLTPRATPSHPRPTPSLLAPRLLTPTPDQARTLRPALPPLRPVSVPSPNRAALGDPEGALAPWVHPELTP